MEPNRNPHWSTSGLRVNEQKQVAVQPNLKSPSIRTPSLLKKSLSISKYLYPFKRISTSIRRNLFTKDDGNFTADLQIYSDFGGGKKINLIQSFCHIT
jgi:hypothetical protein